MTNVDRGRAGVDRCRCLLANHIRPRQPYRLQAVHSAMKAHGYPLRCLVFVCEPDRVEKISRRLRVGSLIDYHKTSIAPVDQGDPLHRGLECFEFLGVPAVLLRGGFSSYSRERSSDPCNPEERSHAGNSAVSAP
jgi:hypothetical protein